MSGGARLYALAEQSPSAYEQPPDTPEVILTPGPGQLSPSDTLTAVHGHRVPVCLRSQTPLPLWQGVGYLAALRCAPRLKTPYPLPGSLLQLRSGFGD